MGIFLAAWVSPVEVLALAADSLNMCRGWKCGKVRKTQERRAERNEGMEIQEHSKEKGLEAFKDGKVNEERVDMWRN